ADGLVSKAVASVDIHRTQAAIGADVIRHRSEHYARGALRIPSRYPRLITLNASTMRQPALGVERRLATGARRRDGLPVDVVGDVAGREHALDVRARRAGLDREVAVLVHVEDAAEEL